MAVRVESIRVYLHASPRFWGDFRLNIQSLVLVKCSYPSVIYINNMLTCACRRVWTGRSKNRLKIFQLIFKFQFIYFLKLHVKSVNLREKWNQVWFTSNFCLCYNNTLFSKIMGIDFMSYALCVYGHVLSPK